jgi:hypothetical protein
MQDLDIRKHIGDSKYASIELHISYTVAAWDLSSSRSGDVCGFRFRNSCRLGKDLEEARKVGRLGKEGGCKGGNKLHNVGLAQREPLGRDAAESLPNDASQRKAWGASSWTRRHVCWRRWQEVEDNLPATWLGSNGCDCWKKIIKHLMYSISFWIKHLMISFCCACSRLLKKVSLHKKKVMWLPACGTAGNAITNPLYGLFSKKIHYMGFLPFPICWALSCGSTDAQIWAGKLNRLHLILRTAQYYYLLFYLSFSFSFSFSFFF